MVQSSRPFPNLASHEFTQTANQAVRQELLDAGIPVLALPNVMGGEVKTKYLGLLNGFVFYRAWRYWVCKGDMPLSHTREIYCRFRDLSIRAGGHAANPDPAEVSSCPEQEALERAVFEDLHRKGVPTTDVIAELEKLPKDPTWPRFISLYHIDTAEGLREFARYINENNIHACNGEAGSYADSFSHAATTIKE